MAKVMVKQNAPGIETRGLVGVVMARRDVMPGCVWLRLPGLGRRMMNWCYLQLVI